MPRKKTVTAEKTAAQTPATEKKFLISVVQDEKGEMHTNYEIQGFNLWEASGILERIKYDLMQKYAKDMDAK